MQAQAMDDPTGRVSPLRDEQPIVFVVDDDISVRESLESLIQSVGWQAEAFASGEEFLSQSRVSRASCLLLDYTLPQLNGLQIQDRVAAERPDMSIIFMSARGDVPTTVKAMKAGAVEFLTKPFDTPVLLDAIRSAIERSRTVLENVARVRVLRIRHAALSAREREVMALVIRGLLNKQIASELAITEITVKSHRGRAMKKMGADSVAELIRMAAALGHPTGSVV